MRSKVSRKPGILAGIIILSLFIAFPILLVMYISSLAFDICPEKIKSYSSPIDETQAGHFVLPQSAHEIVTHFGKGTFRGGCRLSMRFKMQPVDTSGFLAANKRLKLPLSSNEKWIKTALIPTDWDIEGISSFLSGKSIISMDYEQSILIDISNPNQYTVYTITDYVD
jgi:hypothetical protein